MCTHVYCIYIFETKKNIKIVLFFLNKNFFHKLSKFVLKILNFKFFFKIYSNEFKFIVKLIKARELFFSFYKVF